MRIALFYIKNVLACHYALFGYREALERMGHQVIDAPFPMNQIIPQALPVIKPKLPTIEQLLECDLILSTYHEYVAPWLLVTYGEEEWKKVMQRVPVVARYDESMDREDLGLPERVTEFLKWAHYHSFPAAQDAEKFKGQWLPYGADTKWFYPKPEIERKYDVGFIGSLYDKRQKYLAELGKHLAGVTFHLPAPQGIVAFGIGGVKEHLTTELLADGYRSFKIFCCLPPLSNLIVEKVVDAMACGTFVMFPKLPWGPHENMKQFQDGKEIVYYDHGYVGKNAKQIAHYLEHADEREKIAAAGYERVRTEYTLEHMLEQLLSLCESDVKTGRFKTFDNVVEFPGEPVAPPQGEEAPCKTS